jgi:hypothetical protein
MVTSRPNTVGGGSLGHPLTLPILLGPLRMGPDGGSSRKAPQGTGMAGSGPASQATRASTTSTRR